MEDWMPDDDDIENLFHIDQKMKEMERKGAIAMTESTPAHLSQQPDQILSDEDSSDGEENLELELQRHWQDPEVVKRLRHRMISRRSRQKKKRELDDLSETVESLEREYKRLQSTVVAQTSMDGGPVAEMRQKYLELLQAADQLRFENKTLLQAIDRHTTLASSVQASISTVHSWEEDHAQSMGLCDFVAFRALSQSAFQSLMARTMQAVQSFSFQSEPPPAHVVCGWTDRRHVVEKTRLEFSTTKSVSSALVPSIMQQTWAFLTDFDQAAKIMPFLRKMELLQTLNYSPHSAVVIRRDFTFRNAFNPRVHYTTLLVSWKETADGGHAMTWRTIDEPITDEALCESEAWINECIEYVHI
ncbi:unnamed protein product [Aphanomyces euteiches]